MIYRGKPTDATRIRRRGSHSACRRPGVCTSTASPAYFLIRQIYCGRASSSPEPHLNGSRCLAVDAGSPGVAGREQDALIHPTIAIAVRFSIAYTVVQRVPNERLTPFDHHVTVADAKTDPRIFPRLISGIAGNGWLAGGFSGGHELQARGAHLKDLPRQEIHDLAEQGPAGVHPTFWPSESRKAGPRGQGVSDRRRLGNPWKPCRYGVSEHLPRN